jgi:hypothetical protein
VRARAADDGISSAERGTLRGDPQLVSTMRKHLDTPLAAGGHPTVSRAARLDQLAAPE